MEAEPDSNQHNLPHRCSNCEHELSLTAQYCPICGQKTGPSLIPLKSLLVEFFETTLNIDSRFFRTVIHLFSPGYLTREFFKGKHISYFRPFRLFFTTLLLLYAVLGLIYLSKMQTAIDQDTGSLEYFANKRAMTLIEETKQTIGYDTLENTQRAFIDSLTSRLSSTSQLTNITISDTIRLAYEEIYELEVDSIYRKYGITSFTARLFTQQLIRATKEPGKAIQSIITNTSWMILILMPVMAMVLKLLYIRRNKYYVEHLVFLLHYHAAVFVGMIIYIIVLKHLPTWLLIGVPILCIAYLLPAMKSYYQQRWSRTLLKYMIFLSAYAFVLFLFILLTVLVSLLIYK